mmetsp:Transcript_32785/g.78934  ORF Transcript_32785/g.78934 Transcript_32785/m.78934 type:complete len:233 (-) Transcript_32785:617-1315(-)
MAQSLLLVLGFVDLGLAILALGVVVGLLLLERLHHFFDQLRHLLKPNLLSRQRQSNQIKMWVVVARSSAAHKRQCVCSGRLRRGLHLQKRAGRERLLKQLKRIIAVQHLDGVGQSHELLSPGLLDLVIFLALFIAIFLELSGIALILLQRRLGLVQIILHGCDVHRQIPRSLSLFLDGTLGCSDLLVLGGHQSVEIAHSLVLVVGNLVQPLLHLIFHSLEDTDNLPRHGSPV